VKADPAVQRQLLDLADADAELARIDHRRRTLPEIAEIVTAEQSARAKKDAQVSVQTQLDDVDREVKRQEKEIEAVRARADRDAKLMQGGTVAAKQMTDLEHEIATLQRRQGVLEDDLLELMERREALEMDGQHAEVEFAKAEEALTDAAKRRDEVFADMAMQEARATERRNALVPKFPEPLLALYSRIHKQKGTGASLLRSRRCGACHMELDRSVIAQIKATAPDEVVQCEECGAILVRTPESGL
jgi:predicted  nucleic acid-binding Zn-ribbon protein